MHALIPEPVLGKQVDLKETVTFPSAEQAVQNYQEACKRMLHPALWHQLAGTLSATFTVTGEKGDPVNEPVTIGRYLRIDIPGPGPKTGDGYDWVRVELVEDKSEAEGQAYTGMRVRACSNPGNTCHDTAHFFQEHATSTFIIERNGNTVTSFYYGRNEIPNTDTDSTVDKIRNAVIASGALAGLSEAQWTALLKAFLQIDNQ
jgi:hypothetical protein